ncbi:hypothetical protein ACFQ1S_35040, partial [Kibdelosporangium lantanae]
MENLIADCMKAQGFQYVPHVINYSSGQSQMSGDPSQVPYDRLKEFRQKYGYAIYGRDAFPNDPAVGNTQDPPNPNNAIRDGLDPARKQAYDKALQGTMVVENGKKKMTDQGCAGKASLQVYGDHEDKPDPKAQAEYSQLLQQFRTDPQVVKAAQGYATCLRQKGYQVESTKPGSIEMDLQQQVTKERAALPDKIDMATAQQGLRKEITRSLDDLECGRDYEKAAQPFVAKLLASPSTCLLH